jgi:hypothetical protein
MGPAISLLSRTSTSVIGQLLSLGVLGNNLWHASIAFRIEVSVAASTKRAEVAVGLLKDECAQVQKTDIRLLQ